MVTDSLVESKIADGRRLVEQLMVDGFPINAAFWVKTAEEGMCFFYVVSAAYDAQGPAYAYAAIYGSLHKLTDPWVAMSEIKLIGPQNPIALSVGGLMARHPGAASLRYGSKTLGSMAVEEVYVYPPFLFDAQRRNQMTTEEILREVVRLMNRGAGIVEPSRVTLQNGSTFHGVPFSLQLGTQQAMIVQFIADGEVAPRIVRADEIASIL